MEGSGSYEVNVQNFVPTELSNVIEHFLCRLCKLVVWQPKECPKCNSVFCHECATRYITTRGAWQCQECMSKDQVTDMHRVVKEVLDMLVFQCPKCQKVKRNYNDIMRHCEECQEVADPSKSPSVFRTPAGVDVAPLVKPTQPPPVAKALSDLMVFIIEKDSRRFFLYNTKTQAVSTNVVQSQTNFPHNFQAI